MSITTILTDIEGTTSSISFVKDVLFPYAARHIPAYLRAHQHEAQVIALLGQIGEHTGGDASDLDAATRQLLEWMRLDQKITPLKTLQGMVWESGYRNGDYCAHVYADAVEKLRQWKSAGMGLYVYSSGSIYAQKLFFGFSTAGDINPLFSANFDTTIGGKKEAESYQKIARAIDRPPEQILFLSDIREELDAARAAGLQTCWVLRPEDSSAVPQANCPHQTARDFSGITL